MNRFNPYLLLVLATLPTAALMAQPGVDYDELDITIKSMSEKASQIGVEVAKAMQQVDFEALAEDAQRLGALSEKQGREIAAQMEKIDFSAIAKQGQAVVEEAAEVAEKAAKIDWQQFQNQLGVSPYFAFQKEKRIEKSYTVNAGHSLHIDNRYGKVAVHNWNRNEVKVTIRVRTAESSERKAQEALDRVHIDESKAGNRISLTTAISSAASSNWWTMFTDGSDQNRALSIDYEIYMPQKNELAITNRYGSIELDDRDGRTQISVSYGSLMAGRLNARDNSLSIAYSKGNVAYLNEGNVSVRYGDFQLGEAEKLTLALSYTSGSEIGLVNREANVSLKYSGGFELGLGSAIQRADIAAAYSGIKINPAPNATFKFNVAVSYGGFDYNDQYTYINSQSGGNTSKSYTGYWNKASNNSVSVSAKYGRVSID